MLTAKQVEAAKPKEKQYRLSDGNGLYLQVMPTGAKYWRWNTRIDGKQKTISYGVYPEISLAKAREVHANRRDGAILVSDATSAPPFQKVAERWYRTSKPRWKLKHALQVWKTLEAHVFPRIGTRPVDQLNRLALAGLMREIDSLGIPETAHRVAQRIRAVMDFAVDEGMIESHSANGLTRVLTANPAKRHLAALQPSEMPELMSRIINYDGEQITRYGLLLLAHTFVRTGELISMQWEELKGDVWLIPADRMKRARPHVVPLTRQVLALLDELRPVTGMSRYVLSSYMSPNKTISNNTMLFALYRLGYHGRMTGHGFRTVASSVLNEQGFHRDAIERQLAHAETDEVRDAYNRAEYLDERKRMMQWWSDWIDAATNKR